jgi:hypothetical protein
MFHEPLLLIAAFFAFFLLAIVYVRLDFAITKDEGSEAKMKVAGICEKVIAHQVCHTNLSLPGCKDNVKRSFLHYYCRELFYFDKFRELFSYREHLCYTELRIMNYFQNLLLLLINRRNESTATLSSRTRWSS